MKRQFTYFLLVLSLWLGGCKEEFVPGITDFESALVVEANISDKPEIQWIRLSQTTALEQEELQVLNDAEVIVEASTGEQFLFAEAEDGFYYSEIPFAAKPETSYSLYIKTPDGAVYNSSMVELPEAASLVDVYAERVVKNGVEGVQIYADSKGGQQVGSYFRYKYEETFEIESPYFSDLQASIINVENQGEEFEVEVVRKPNDDGKICYSSNYSDEINQITTSGLSDNFAKAVPIRFIPANDPILRERYSIKVSQYVQTPEAFAFYKILDDLGSSGSILSENQPGAIQGNLHNATDPDEHVVGYFGVYRKESKRIFFNYEDFGLSAPPYFYECEFFTYDYKDNASSRIDGDLNERNFLYNSLKGGSYRLVSQQGNNGEIYTIARVECTDCTSFSSKIKPEFWID